MTQTHSNVDQMDWGVPRCGLGVCAAPGWRVGMVTPTNAFRTRCSISRNTATSVRFLPHKLELTEGPCRRT